MKIDKKLIKELSDYLSEFNLTEIEYGNNDLKVKVSKNLSSPTISIPQTNEKKLDSKVDKTVPVSNNTKVTSPIIGTAYLSPEPGAKQFIEIGKKIRKGETLMIVEAMKTMNHVPCPSDGTIKEICVTDGQPVEFGQTIIILD